MRKNKRKPEKNSRKEKKDNDNCGTTIAQRRLLAWRLRTEPAHEKPAVVMQALAIRRQPRPFDRTQLPRAESSESRRDSRPPPTLPLPCPPPFPLPLAGSPSRLNACGLGPPLAPSLSPLPSRPAPCPPPPFLRGCCRVARGAAEAGGTASLAAGPGTTGSGPVGDRQTLRRGRGRPILITRRPHKAAKRPRTFSGIAGGGCSLLREGGWRLGALPGSAASSETRAKTALREATAVEGEQTPRQTRDGAHRWSATRAAGATRRATPRAPAFPTEGREGQGRTEREGRGWGEGARQRGKRGGGEGRGGWERGTRPRERTRAPMKRRVRRRGRGRSRRAAAAAARARAASTREQALCGR